MTEAYAPETFSVEATRSHVCWMWTLLVEDEYFEGSGGRKIMQIPSFHDTEDGIKKEVESRWSTAVVAFKGKKGLWYNDELKKP